MTLQKTITTLALLISSGAAVANPTTSFVDFSKGAQGWEGTQPTNGIGGSWIDTTAGNGAPALHTVIENYGINFSNRTNSNYLGNYSKLGSVTIGLDVIANSIRTGGREIASNLVVELRDYDNASQDMPFTSVWYDLGKIDYTMGWQHMSVTISDTTSSTLPAGWRGYGARGDAAGPSLPTGRSFADVLSSVDELVFTTFVPDSMYGYTDFDVAVDNISVTAVPEPSSYAMMLGGLCLMGLLTRRSRAKPRQHK